MFMMPPATRNIAPPPQNGFTNKKHRFSYPNRSPCRWLLGWWIQMLNVASRNWFIEVPSKMGVPLEVPLMAMPNLSKPQFPCFLRPKPQSYPWFPCPFFSHLHPTHQQAIGNIFLNCLLLTTVVQTTLISALEFFLKSLRCNLYVGFSGGSDNKDYACNAGDPGSIPGSGRSPGEGNGYSLQYSCLENSVDSISSL